MPNANAPTALPLTSAALVSHTPLRLQVSTFGESGVFKQRAITSCKPDMREKRRCVFSRLCPWLVDYHPYRLRKPCCLDSQDTARDDPMEHQVLDPSHSGCNSRTGQSHSAPVTHAESPACCLQGRNAGVVCVYAERHNANQADNPELVHAARHGLHVDRELRDRQL